MDDKLSLRWFLIRNFIIIMIVVAIVEVIISEVVNRFIFPFLQATYFSNLDWKGRLNATQTGLVIIVIIIELLLLALKTIIPGSVASSIQYVVDQLENLVMAKIPNFYGHNQIAQISKMQTLSLFLITAAIMVITIIPYLLAATIYAGLVTNEVNKINEREKRIHAEYDKKRNLMLSDIAHDLRTPITTVSGYAKALQDGMVKDEEKKQEYLDAIQRKSARMSDLINLLFEYVKLDSDGFQLNKKKIDLMEMLRSNAAMNYSDIEEHGMELEVDIPETFYYVEADELQMSRVITNLITNAIRHNQPGNHIFLGVEKVPNAITILIADDGDKIPDEVAQHLFEPFAVGDESRNSKGGSGLGLSIAAKIVEMHGWSIRFQSVNVKYEKAFVITIPDKEIYS